jgi:hypothetical protein
MVGFVHHQNSRETLLKTCNHVTAQIQQKLTLLDLPAVGSRKSPAMYCRNSIGLKRGLRDVRIRNIGARQYLKKAPD